MKTIRPLFDRATVIESPVDEAQRTSGLIVPMSFDGDDEIKRGVILEVDASHSLFEEEAKEVLTPGRVVYFQRFVKVGDVYIIDIHDILAYEDDE